MPKLFTKVYLDDYDSCNKLARRFGVKLPTRQEWNTFSSDQRLQWMTDNLAEYVEKPECEPIMFLAKDLQDLRKNHFE